MQAKKVFEPFPAFPSDSNDLAKRRVLRFFSLNGVAVTFVMENILLLWALQNGLSAPQVAVLTSLIFLTMPFMFAGKQLTMRVGFIRAWSLCWFLRYLFVLLMIPVPWLRGGPWESAIPSLILFCTFALFSLRSMGMINTVPVIGAISDPSDVGSFHAAALLRHNITYAGTLVLVNLILGWRDSIGIYQVFLLAGAVSGLTSVAVLRRVPEPPGLFPDEQRPFKKSWQALERSTPLRRLAWAWAAATTLVALTAPINILAVKNGYGASDQVALLFIIIEVGGAIVAAWLVGLAADHSGPRPLLVLGLALLLAPTLYWVLAPATLWWPALIGAFLSTGAAKSVLLLALSHYLLASTQAKERLDLGIIMQMASGAASGLAGIVVAAGLLRLLAPAFGDGLMLYRIYFTVILAGGSVIAIATAIALPRLQDWAVRDVIGLLFSLNDIRALFTLNRMKRSSSDEEELDELGRLSVLGSRRSEPVLRRFVQEGRLMTQARAIEALSRVSFGAETVEALIQVVEAGAYTNGWRAAELLGRRRAKTAVTALRAGLGSEDPFLAGKCMVALVRLEDKTSYPVIRSMFQTTKNPRIVVHGAVSMQGMQSKEDTLLLLEKCVEREWPSFVVEELALTIAALHGCRRIVHRHLGQYSVKVGKTPLPEPRLDALACRDPVWQAFLARHPWVSLPQPLQITMLTLITKASQDRPA